MADKKLCVPCNKWYSRKSGLNRHVKKFHDSQRNVRRLAESEPGTVDKNDHPTPKVRKFIFPEDIKDEIDMLVLSKQLENKEKVAMDEDGHLEYIKLLLNYLQR